MNSKIFLFILVSWSFYQISFGETTQNTEDQYRDDRFGGGVVEDHSSVSTSSPDPDTTVEPYIPGPLPTGGQGPRYEEIPPDHQKAPIFSKFKRVFFDCTPIGCDMGQGQCFGTRGKASCHTTGDAIDLHSIRCNGQEYDSNHHVFVRMVQCIRTRFHKGRRWKVLHQDNTGQCDGVGLHSGISKITSCHWDHAHFSVGCRRNGGVMW